MSNTITLDAGSVTGGLTNAFNTPTSWNGSLAGTVSITQSKEFKAGTVTINGEGTEVAEFDAAFINDLKLLLEVINDLPDEHPMGDLKHDMRMRRAFKRLGG